VNESEQLNKKRFEEIQFQGEQLRQRLLQESELAQKQLEKERATLKDQEAKLAVSQRETEETKTALELQKTELEIERQKIASQTALQEHLLGLATTRLKEIESNKQELDSRTKSLESQSRQIPLSNTAIHENPNQSGMYSSPESIAASDELVLERQKNHALTEELMVSFIRFLY
jgi:hypothetical protein